ncbi:hypothetical protein OPT61_g1887 [Boeremia exigua]|uniref:Uncharacterized protein n=1 Tax=Boeremia exigua TaxID=749465 RepID=A0ACC2INN2_9PLEO|nr:hypothetical protein OPT61_g1887 [Boeremia exigua]
MWWTVWCFCEAFAHHQLSQQAPPARTTLAKRQAATPPAASSLHSKLGEHSSSATPPTWSSTLPTLPSAHAHRSTGAMRRRGSSTATGTGCDRRGGNADTEGRICTDVQQTTGSPTAEADRTEQAPEIQTMYSLNMPVSTLRTKIRQEFERHRYVNQMKTVDVLLFNSHQEFQETLNYWKQLSHVLKYFRSEEDPKARLPANFINGFLEGRN